MTNVMNSSMTSCLQLIEGNLLFSGLIDNLFEGLCLIDKDKNVLYWNKAAEDITGIKQDEMINTTCLENKLKLVDKKGNEFKPEEHPINECSIKGEVIKKKALVVHEDGFPIPILITAIPLKDNDGSFIGAAEIFVDDSAHEDLEKAQEKIKESSKRDELTNLFTRKEIINRVCMEVKKASRYEMPLCTCICDIDNFKVINDKYGIQTGDTIIQKVSNIIKENLRMTDSVGRYGGESFMILLPLIDIHRAKKVVQKIQSKFGKTEFDEITDKISLSFGLTQIALPDSHEAMLERSESALNKAKKLGKGSIEVFM